MNEAFPIVAYLLAAASSGALIYTLTNPPTSRRWRMAFLFGACWPLLPLIIVGLILFAACQRDE